MTIYKPWETAVYKGNNPILREFMKTIWLLTTYPSHGIPILQVYTSKTTTTGLKNPLGIPMTSDVRNPWSRQVRRTVTEVKYPSPVGFVSVTAAEVSSAGPDGVGWSTRLKHIETWVVVSNIFCFHPYLGKWSKLTNIFQMGWNHQLETHGSLKGIHNIPKHSMYGIFIYKKG